MKTFYSAEDIEALAVQGITELRLSEDTVLTQLARDAAQKLGIALVYAGAVSRRASSDVAQAPSPPPTPRLGAKPKGCQHGPLAGSSSGGGGSTGTSDKAVSELIDLVKQLADKGKP
ncbi:MAG: hypothetical protein ACK2UA_05420 [Anaerolineae bacterium]|jgi:hypothetical protein